MTAKVIFLALILICTNLKAVYGTPFSNVYVRSNLGRVPLDYVSYGSPQFSVKSSQIADLSTSPVLTTCVSPCVIPASSFDASQWTSNNKANVLSYNSVGPSASFVLPPSSDESTSYEYSYVVYDENTGDHKEQSELSDGSLVQGQYSFIQPDGLVRQVKYTADDLKGFNAIVRNFWPSFGTTESKESNKKEKPLLELKEEKKENTNPSDNVNPKTKQLLTKVEPTTVPPPSKLISMTTSVPNESGTKAKVSEKLVSSEAPISTTTESLKPGTSEKTALNSNKTLTEQVVSDKPALKNIIPEPQKMESTSTTKMEDTQSTTPSSVKDTTQLSDKPQVAPLTSVTKTSITISSAPTTEIATVTKDIKSSVASGIATYSDIIRCLQTAIESAQKSPQPAKTPLTYIILPTKPC